MFYKARYLCISYCYIDYGIQVRVVKLSENIANTNMFKRCPQEHVYQFYQQFAYS